MSGCKAEGMYHIGEKQDVLSASAFREECSMLSDVIPTKANNMFTHIHDVH